MAVPFNLPRADEDDYQLIHELLMTVQRAVYQIIFRRRSAPQHQPPPPNPQPRLGRGGCPHCGCGGGGDDDDRGSPPGAVPGGGGAPAAPAGGEDDGDPSSDARRLPDVVPPPPPRRPRRARRRRPPPPAPPPLRSKYWEAVGEDLRRIADEFRPTAPKDLLGRPPARIKDTNVLALLFPKTVWAALILLAGWKLARKVR
ncbi:uncharacterized protein LOC134527608 isoform X1 [Bacillus rossius redtenbacheri]|uniref:uncharacterized protein LOC134527608 isoform X1 n=1 Tax=Bacillus rossius redtenbacheri TaxID=93214 RepID=UPI002FDE9EF0